VKDGSLACSSQTRTCFASSLTFKSKIFTIFWSRSFFFSFLTADRPLFVKKELHLTLSSAPTEMKSAVWVFCFVSSGSGFAGICLLQLCLYTIYILRHDDPMDLLIVRRQRRLVGKIDRTSLAFENFLVAMGPQVDFQIMCVAKFLLALIASMVALKRSKLLAHKVLGQHGHLTYPILVHLHNMSIQHIPMP
jgi:hypothetical protein